MKSSFLVKRQWLALGLVYLMFGCARVYYYGDDGPPDRRITGWKVYNWLEQVDGDSGSVGAGTFLINHIRSMEVDSAPDLVADSMVMLASPASTGSPIETRDLVRLKGFRDLAHADDFVTIEVPLPDTIVLRAYYWMRLNTDECDSMPPRDYFRSNPPDCDSNFVIDYYLPIQHKRVYGGV